MVAIKARQENTQAEELEHHEEDELKALKSLKEKLVTPPVRALPKKHGDYTLYTDACD